MKNIFLVGMPGSGKSTLGKKIAEILGRKFLDTDEEIRKREGFSPEEIILYQGEKKLRLLEQSLLRELVEIEGLVIATGGGFPIFHGLMNQMNSTSITVYIRYSPELLWNRIREDRARPLSSSLDSTLDLLRKREEIYSRALITVNGEENMETNMENILCAIKEAFPEEIGNEGQ